MNKREIFRPSRSHIWSNCTAAPAVMRSCEAAPPNTYMETGTRAHALADRIFKHPHEAPEVPEDVDETAVREYVATVKSMTASTIFAASEMPIRVIGGIDGTADYCALVKTGKETYELQVHDLKYGRGEVYAARNPQLLCYADGALSFFAGVLGFSREEITHVRLVIHQPLIARVDEWACTMAEMQTCVSAINSAYQKGLSLYKLAEHCNIKNLRLEYTTGDHCKRCPALESVRCPKVDEEVFRLLTHDPKPGPETAEKIGESIKSDTEPGGKFTDVEQAAVLSTYLPHLGLIGKWCEAVQTRAKSLIENGTAVPGYKVVKGRKGDRKWADEIEAEALMKKKKLKKAEMYTQKLKSPSQLEKAIPKQKYTAFQDIMCQSDGKNVLVPEGDKRPALDFTPIGKQFEDMDT